MVLSACATTYGFSPHAEPSQTVRYSKGVPVIRSEGAKSVVQVSPLGIQQQNGRLTLAVVAYNTSEQSSEFGYENISLSDGVGQTVRLFDHSRLEREAKNAATWAAVGVALGGAAQAYNANQNAYTTTTATATGPRGTTTYRAQTYNPATAQALTALAAAETTVGMVAISNSLDRTLESLDGSILQTSTIDPGQSYGGHVVGDRMKLPGGTADFVLTVRYNEDVHTFRFTIAARTN